MKKKIWWRGGDNLFVKKINITSSKELDPIPKRIRRTKVK